MNILTPGVGGLVTTTVLNAKLGEVETKIPDDNGLVKKKVYNAKRLDFEANILLYLIK